MTHTRGAWSLVLALIVSGLAPVAHASPGADPAIYHTIVSRSGSATASTLDGCRRTTVFVSSSDAMYAAQPGPVNKQGLTSVFVRVTDACSATPEEGAVPLAAGGGEPVVYEAAGQSLARLQADQRLAWARISTTITTADASGSPLIDSDGNRVEMALLVEWTGVGPLDHSTGHNHVLFPDEGVVSSTGNNLMRAATAHVALTVGPVALDADAAEASLEQVRSRCVEVARPGADEFYPCFGFPG